MISKALTVCGRRGSAVSSWQAAEADNRSDGCCCWARLATHVQALLVQVSGKELKRQKVWCQNASAAGMIQGHVPGDDVSNELSFPEYLLPIAEEITERVGKIGQYMLPAARSVVELYTDLLTGGTNASLSCLRTDREARMRSRFWIPCKYAMRASCKGMNISIGGYTCSIVEDRYLPRPGSDLAKWMSPSENILCDRGRQKLHWEAKYSR